MKETKQFSESELEQAAEILKKGGTIAFPTETVFGLGANALDASAISGIYEAKGRPSDNPLIVHIASREILPKIASHIPDIAFDLMDAFTPGPLTLVLRKTSSVATNVTAGLDSVAVRIPNHPAALKLLQLASIPIAAPSANRSGRPSGTTWQSVLEDLDGFIDGIVCVEGCKIGLESTVLDLQSEVPRILRQGSVTLESIRKIVPSVVSFEGDSQSVNSPGLRHRHYQPKAKVCLVDLLEKFEVVKPSAYIGLESPTTVSASDVVEICSGVDDYASKLYEFFRRCDRLGIATIYCQSVPAVGVGRALLDRIRRASE